MADGNRRRPVRRWLTRRGRVATVEVAASRPILAADRRVAGRIGSVDDLAPGAEPWTASGYLGADRSRRYDPRWTAAVDRMASPLPLHLGSVGNRAPDPDRALWTRSQRQWRGAVVQHRAGQRAANGGSQAPARRLPGRLSRGLSRAAGDDGTTRWPVSP